MPTRRSTTEQDLIKDARHVHAMATDQQALFKKREKEKEKEPTITDAFLKQLGRDIDDYEQAVEGRVVRRMVAAQAARTEEERRAAVYDCLVAMRRDAKAIKEPSAAMLAAVGVGVVLKPQSTQALTLAAGGLLQWADDDDAHKAELKRAGITDKRLKELRAARDALAGADTEQSRKKGEAVVHTMSKAELRKLMVAGVKLVRDSAASLFAGEPKVLALFDSPSPRYTPTPRPPRQPRPTTPQ